MKELPCKTCVVYPICKTRFIGSIKPHYVKKLKCYFKMDEIIIAMLSLARTCNRLDSWVYPEVQTDEKPSIIFIEKQFDVHANMNAILEYHISSIHEDIFIPVNSNRLVFIREFYDTFDDELREATESDLRALEFLKETYKNKCIEQQNKLNSVIDGITETNE